MNLKYIAFILSLVVVALVLFYLLSPDTDETGEYTKAGSAEKTEGSAEYTGRKTCIPCHQREAQLWKNSDHDRAMQIAADSTVLGDFNHAAFTWFGVTSRFFKKDGDFYVNTQDEDDTLRDFKITYTFGIRPLQQYLITFPDGRIQTLPLCWDARPKEKGGQRWFHIYANEQIKPDDLLFWTGINQNWNYMCAECHSTNVKKNYDYHTETYLTTFSEIDVSCEMCHGPGSTHVAWAELFKKEKRVSLEGDLGLVVRLKDLNQGTWVFKDMEKGTAERTAPLSSAVQIETCALCHSRRSQLTDNYVHGQPILNTHRLPFLDEPLYFPDGQIREEVYEYHSFLQSKMYSKGVVCSDCHEPHSAKVYSDDNSLCFRCHLPQKFDTPAHHFHKPDSSGASCRDCHMPERTYMVVDPRRDHSIRIPRPDLSDSLGTPNACIQCHQDKTNRWATEYVDKWYGKTFSEKPHFAKVFAAVRRGLPNMGDPLRRLTAAEDQPPMVKATALSLLRVYPDPSARELIQTNLYDKDPLIRLAALTALENFSLDERFLLAKNLLEDPVKSVRTQAAYLLSEVAQADMTAFDRAALNKALAEYTEAQLFNADQPSALVNLGVLYTRQEKFTEAELAYRKAIEKAPAFVYAYVNLSDLYRQQGKDQSGEEVIKNGLKLNPQSAELYNAYGLLLTRQKKREEAVQAFKKVVEYQPDNWQARYYLGLAMLETGKVKEASKILEAAQRLFPANTELLFALATINRDQGDMKKALKYANDLANLAPDNAVYNQLLQEIQQKFKEQ
jgi:Flp pilus assembly protein TadD